MEYLVRPIQPEEYGMLADFCYEAIFVPEGVEPPPRSIVELPELRIYHENFGGPDDHGMVAEVDGQVAGAVWLRIMNDYGHVDDAMPSLSIALLPRYRGQGVGTALLTAMLAKASEAGYPGVSLSVQKANPAHRLYRRCGFEEVVRNEEEFIMVRPLVNPEK